MPEIACIEPRIGDKIASLYWFSLVDNLGRLSVAPSARSALRVHWFSCPHCRENFPYTQEILAVITHAIKDRVAASLDRWTEKWNSASESGQAEDADESYWLANRLAELTFFGIEVQGALSFVVEELTDFTTEFEPLDTLHQRQPLSKCADFILGLKREVQQFVFEAVRCQEMLMPPVQLELGPLRMPFPKSDDETSNIETDFQEVAREKASALVALRDHFENSFAGVLEGIFRSVEVEAYISLEKFSQNNPPSSATSAELSARSIGIASPSSNELERIRREMSDGFDSLKAGQMEIIRLSEQSSRSAAAFGPEIELKLGSSYLLLNGKTRLLLQGAEFLYQINRSEPNFHHGAVISLALAYENEMLLRLIWPYIEKLRTDGVANYDGKGDLKRSLLSQGVVQERNLNLGNFRWYLGSDVQIRAWVKGSRGLNLQNIETDASRLVRGRDIAAHKAECNQSLAAELRALVLTENGCLARLHRS